MKKQKDKGYELVYGVHPIQELLKAKQRKLAVLYTTKPTPKAWRSIERLLPSSVQIQYVQKQVLSRMAGTTDHQSLVGLAAPFVKRKKFFDADKQPFLLMLDSIHDPRNLGAILRSAYCTGVDGIIIGGKNSAPLGATALKASAGLAEHLAIYQAPSTMAAVDLLKKGSYELYLATVHGGDAMAVEYTKPLCLVIGNEATGIAHNVLPHGTQIRLAQRTSDISYNASVAAGILLFLIGHHLGALQAQ